MVIDRLLSRFRDPVELGDPSDAAEVFRRERAEELERARDRFSEIREDVDLALADLDQALADLAGYDDAEGRSMIEDVVDNVVRQRRDAIDAVGGDGPRELKEELDGFVDDFLEMTQKESMVMDAIGEAKQPVFEALDAVKSHRDDLDRFLDTGHAAMERDRDLRSAVDRLEDLRGERDTVAAELAGIDIETLRRELDSAEAELDELHDGEEWTEYGEVRSDLEDARGDRASVERDVERAMNALERGLKKMVYEVEHGDLSVDADLDLLKSVRDGETGVALSEPEAVSDAVGAAAEALPPDLLGDRQAEKFRGGARTLADLPDLAEEHGWLDDRVAELEEAVADHPAPAREEELEARVGQLEDRIAARAERRKDLRARREELEDEIAAVEDEIASMLEDALDREVRGD